MLNGTAFATARSATRNGQDRKWPPINHFQAERMKGNFFTGQGGHGSRRKNPTEADEIVFMNS